MIARRTLFWMTSLSLLLMFSGVYGQQPEGGRRGPRPPGPRFGVSDAEKEKARQRIGITREQQQQLEALLEETGKQTRAVFEQLREKHEQLQAVYEAYEIDKNKERALMRDISRLRYRLLQIHSEHEAKVRQVLTKEQHERLRALMKEAMENARRAFPGPGRFGPPPPGGREGPGSP